MNVNVVVSLWRMYVGLFSLQRFEETFAIGCDNTYSRIVHGRESLDTTQKQEQGQ